MNKINQFTFSQNPEYIMNTALDVFGDDPCSRSEYFVFSTENEKFIDYLVELYSNRIGYYILDGYEYVLRGRRNTMGIDSLEPLPVYGIISYMDLTNGKAYKTQRTPFFENILTYKFGIECHYNLGLGYTTLNNVERIYDEQNKPIYVLVRILKICLIWPSPPQTIIIPIKKKNL